MNTFQEECSELGPLETFDPRTFKADDKVPQDLCNFILALAVVYNDCKNLIYARIVFSQFRPVSQFTRTRLWGAYSGIEFHILRLVCGLLHELFKLIRKNEHLLNHPFFISVIRQTDPSARRGWETVVEVTKGTTPSNPLGEILARVRNKMSFHYDGEEILRGYSQHFFKSQHMDERAYISRGNSMKETRFYFADVVTEGYLRSIAGKETIEGILLRLVELLDPVNRSLMAIVESFIQKRGYPFRIESEKIG